MDAFDPEATSEEDFRAKYGFERPKMNDNSSKTMIVHCRYYYIPY